MTKQVSSTFRIVKDKVLDKDINESWVDWAIEMIEAGYEILNLYELAGITRPYNQFELRYLTEKIFGDLNISYKDKEAAIRNYACFIISNSIGNPSNYLSTLLELKGIYLELDWQKEYSDFYLLYFAKYDLTNYEDQFYWIGADKKNIDDIIKKRFQNFLDNVDVK